MRSLIHRNLRIGCWWSRVLSVKRKQKFQVQVFTCIIHTDSVQHVPVCCVLGFLKWSVYVYGCFVCKNVCALWWRTESVRSPGTGISDGYEPSCMYVLGIKPMSSGRKASSLNHWASFQTLCLSVCVCLPTSTYLPTFLPIATYLPFKTRSQYVALALLELTLKQTGLKPINLPVYTL